MPVTTMEEIPVLTEAERVAFVTSLKEGEASIEAGDGLSLDAKGFKEWLFSLYRRA